MSSNVEINGQSRMAGYFYTFSYASAIAVIEGAEEEKKTGGFAGITVMNLLGYIPGVSLIV